MTDFDNKAQFDTVRSRAASTFTGSYQTLGSAISNRARVLYFVNNTSQDVTVSIDGTNDHIVIPSGAFFLLDLAANAISSNGLYIPQGTQVYVNAAAGTGTFYLTVLYSERN